MKRQIFFWVALVVLTTTGANAENKETEIRNTTPLPAECSALFLNSDYARILSEETEQASQAGRTLRIDGCDVVVKESSTTACINLSIKDFANASSQWLPHVAITGLVRRNQPTEAPVIDAVNVLPRARPRGGGASVGNGR